MSRATRFKRWLIDQIKTTQWPRRTGESDEELACALGVQVEVLRVAAAELRREAERAGRIPRAPGSLKKLADQVAYPALELTMPEPIWKEWTAYCERRGLNHATVLRSLVHQYLCQKSEPTWLGRQWLHRGKILKLDGFKNHVKWPWTAATRVSNGAARALKMRAERLRVTRTAILRGLATDLLAGKITKIPMVSVELMWNDPDRYFR